MINLKDDINIIVPEDSHEKAVKDAIERIRSLSAAHIQERYMSLDAIRDALARIDQETPETAANYYDINLLRTQFRTHWERVHNAGALDPFAVNEVDVDESL